MPDAPENIPPQARPKWFKRLRLALISVIAIYLAICITMYFLQDFLIFPGSLMQGRPDSQKVSTEHTELIHFATADGTPLVGRFCPVAVNADRAPTVLYFYGNGSCAAWAIGEVELLRDLGCNVFVPDFEGYGMSGGKASEANLYATATAAWDYLQNRPGVDHAKVLTMGWSIGSAVAIDLASRKPVAGLITLAAFTSLADAGQAQYPWLPVRMLIHYRFDSYSKLAAIHCPVLIAHGDQDEIVPPAMAETLAGGLGNRATRIVLRGSGHNTVFSVDTPRLREAILALLAPLMHGTATPG